MENIIVSCLESKRNVLIEHVLNDCNIVGKILEAEKQPTLQSDSTKVQICLLTLVGHCCYSTCFELYYSQPFLCSLQFVQRENHLQELETLVT